MDPVVEGMKECGLADDWNLRFAILKEIIMYICLTVVAWKIMSVICEGYNRLVDVVKKAVERDETDTKK